MGYETEIANLDRYMTVESLRLATASAVERKEIFAEVDECLEQLVKLGHFAVDEFDDTRVWKPSFPDTLVTRVA